METTDQGQQTTAAAQTAGREISLLDILLVFVRGWRVILIGTLLGCGWMLYKGLSMKPFYAATVTVLPPQQNSGSGLAAQLMSQSGLAATFGAGLRTEGDLYMGLLRSNAVEDLMITTYGLQKEYGTKLLSETRKALGQHMGIDVSSKDGLIRITDIDMTPERAAQLANAYVEAYKHVSANLAVSAASQRRRFLEGQLAQTRESLMKSEEQMKQLEQGGGALTLDSGVRTLIESASRLRAEIAEKQVQVQSLRTHEGPENPQLVQAQQELASLNAQLAQLGGTGTGAEGLLPNRGVVPQQSLDYARALRDVKFNETMFDLLAKDYELAKLDEAREGALIQVVDPATPPDKPAGPDVLRMTLMGTAAGFLLSCAWVFLRAIYRYLRRTQEYGMVLAAVRREARA